ncbi:enoyl-CoA hydratase/isomerase family protein [Actinomadura sp. KC345]|uniref:enoyl-CoA hydratase/isomerase family protein n=1 Tax=Actinomadura sp. KC345 TaxID=2530371 RepID=UPI001047C41C|nr:enoyl-CoA hydratase/isomerase family protein [Actinomadura sp. KC345]TDC55485.1 enoyl-CoA hydratase/isomerase family protein [Actinomadura sp. KC345]
MSAPGSARPDAPGTATYEVQDGVATLTLRNARRKNAITLAMAGQIAEFCAMVADDTAIGAVVVRGDGGYFCSGADTRDLAASSADAASPEAVARTSAVYGSFVGIGSLPVPTVSVVTGGAVGAGLNLALATDLMVATPDAVLDSGFLARRIHPGGGHLGLLGRAVGRPTAVSMALFGQAISGGRAAELGWGLAVPADRIDAEVAELVAMPAQDPELTRRVTRSLKLELGPPAVSWDQAVEIERGVQMWSLGRKGREGWATNPSKPQVPGR